ncbi:MAG: lysine biosynthesis protein LysW [Chloroflexi bacterium]|nr:MAG: lysine biosynthesis protein LysW [Chloroflexota bacterium]
MAKTRCPNCDSVINEDRPREGSIIECPKCGVELEVVTVDPFRVEFTDEWQED